MADLPRISDAVLEGASTQAGRRFKLSAEEIFFGFFADDMLE